MLRIGIISNPYARIHKRRPYYNTNLWYALGNHGQYRVTHSFAELDDVCREFYEMDVDLVGIVGGDGTVSLTLSSLAKTYRDKPLPKILLLPGGTINFLASNLRIKKNAEVCLRKALLLMKTKQRMQEFPLQTLCVNGRLGFIFASGLAPLFLQDCYNRKKNVWKISLKILFYCLELLIFNRLAGFLSKKHQCEKSRIFYSLRRENDKEYCEEPMLTFISTLSYLPFRLKFFKNISLGQSYCEILTLAMRGRKILYVFFLAFLRLPFAWLSGVNSFLADKVKIQCEKKSLYSVDGDLFFSQNGKIDVDLGPVFIFCSPYK